MHTYALLSPTPPHLRTLTAHNLFIQKKRSDTFYIAGNDFKRNKKVFNMLTYKASLWLLCIKSRNISHSVWLIGLNKLNWLYHLEIACYWYTIVKRQLLLTKIISLKPAAFISSRVVLKQLSRCWNRIFRKYITMELWHWQQQQDYTELYQLPCGFWLFFPID